jgi:UDP-glucose 4-epimerase
MKSLVTGCAGFIGSHLTERLLREGHVVVGIDCFTNYYARTIKEANMKGFEEDENFHFIENDINRVNLSELLEDVDFVFHMAAQAGVKLHGLKSRGV